MKQLIKNIFLGEGEMIRLFSETDWSCTQLGPVSTWPQPLHTTVGIALASRFPIMLFWGQDLLVLYNDAFRPVLGTTKHPQAFGRAAREVWAEIWDITEPMLESVMQTGQATWMDNQVLLLNRNNYLEETYFTYSFSPIYLKDGTVGGVFTALQETTERVLSESRVSLLRDLGAGTSDLSPIDVTVAKVISIMRTYSKIVPFVSLYLSHGNSAERAASTISLPQRLAPASLLLEDGQPAQAGRIAGLPFNIQHLCVQSPGWSHTVQQAVWIPLAASRQSRPVGHMLVGISPHRAFDKEYETFIYLLSGQVASVFQSSMAFEQEVKQVKALSMLDQAKNTFFDNISHEFRTPLTLMLAPLGDLLNQAGTDQQRLELEAVKRNAVRLLKLVNNMLDASRIEAGKYEVCFELTDLGAFTADIAGEFRQAIEGQGVIFEINCQTPLENAYVDRDAWEKIILNLLSNAFKFTLSGKISVSLKLTGSSFLLSVADTGAGIPADEISKVFQRFHQVKSENARTHEGSGIGLALVSELVRLHGGTVNVTSEPGIKTEFVAEIPRGCTHLPPEHIRYSAVFTAKPFQARAFVEDVEGWSIVARARIGSGQDNCGSSTQSVFIVDDNADMRAYLGRLLGQLWTVETFSNARDAWGALQDNPPDLVVVDVMMPDISGIDLLKFIRSADKLCHTPVLLLSAQDSDEAKSEGIECGADDYLVKPFTPRELYARTSRLLHQRVLSQSLETAVRERTKELEYALGSKSHFLATVSHEVRTPISGLMGLIELILASEPEGETHELASLAFDTARRLLYILNDLLDASKIDAGEIKLENRFFAVRPVIGDIVELARPDAAKKDLRIISSVADDVPDFLCGDERRLRQILGNLVSNAVKFTQAGRIEIEAKLAGECKGKAKLAFSVKDTGIGINREQQANLFQAFDNMPASTLHLVGKAGLGLSLCQILAELMGGEIEVESEPGKGSTFWVYIPFSESACRVE